MRARFDDCAAGSDCGSAYVFRYDPQRPIGDRWVEEQKLTASDAAQDDYFGQSVSLSGDRAIVGAHYDDCPAGANCGSAYFYRYNGTAWVEEQKLTASDAAAGDFFGIYLSLSGDRSIVGAHNDDCTAGVDCGAAYVYRYNGTAWVEEQKLTASDAAALDLFGDSVSLSGDKALVGATGDACAAGADCGSVYVFSVGGPDCNANGIPDECEPDGDADGIPDSCDNCPTVPNPKQEDPDGDGIGFACDAQDIPTVSAWGLAIAGLLILVAGTLTIRRVPRRCGRGTP